MKNAILFAPPAGGKGRSTDYLIPRLRNRAALVELGKEFRDRRKRDAEFNRVHGPTMDRGDYLPDTVCSETLELILPGLPETELTIFDGINRTPEQVPDSERLGIMGPNTLLIVLCVSLKVCIERNEHRAKRKGLERPDSAFLEHRYNIFESHFHNVIEASRRTGVRIVEIDANRDLETVECAVACRIGQFLESEIIPLRAPRRAPYSFPFWVTSSLGDPALA